MDFKFSYFGSTRLFRMIEYSLLCALWPLKMYAPDFKTPLIDLGTPKFCIFVPKFAHGTALLAHR